MTPRPYRSDLLRAIDGKDRRPPEEPETLPTLAVKRLLDSAFYPWWVKDRPAKLIPPTQAFVEPPREGPRRPEMFRRKGRRNP